MPVSPPSSAVMLVSVARSSVVKRRDGVARELEHLADAAAAADCREGQQMQHDVLGCHAGGHVALEFDAQYCGIVMRTAPVTKALAMSVVPTPKATHPSAPLCGVWESVPTTTWPGRA